MLLNLKNKSTLIALFSHHLSNFFRPHSVAFFVLFAWAFCSISFSCSWPESEPWLQGVSSISKVSWELFSIKKKHNNLNGLLNSRHLYTRFLIGQSQSYDVSSANQEQGGKWICRPHTVIYYARWLDALMRAIWPRILMIIDISWMAVMLCDVVRRHRWRAHAPVIHAASHFDHNKRVA